MKILLADDHALFREGMRHVLTQLGEDIAITEAGDFSQIQHQLATQEDITLVLLDLHMPKNDGLAVLEYIGEQFPALPVVMLSGSESRDDMQRAIDLGAVGFIEKSSTAQVMLSALNLVLSGGIYIPPAMVRRSPVSPETLVEGSGQNTLNLTPRQLDVLKRIIEGQPNKIIADELGVSIATVKAHVTATLKALRVTNRTQAARAVEQAGVDLRGNARSG